MLEIHNNMVKKKEKKKNNDGQEEESRVWGFRGGHDDDDDVMIYCTAPRAEAESLGIDIIIHKFDRDSHTDRCDGYLMSWVVWGLIIYWFLRDFASVLWESVELLSRRGGGAEVFCRIMRLSWMGTKTVVDDGNGSDCAFRISCCSWTLNNFSSRFK